MKVVHKNFIINAEQFLPGKVTPKGCKGYGTHVSEFVAYAKVGKSTKKLKPESWVVTDGFGNISIYSPAEFVKEFVEVKV